MRQPRVHGTLCRRVARAGDPATGEAPTSRRAKDQPYTSATNAEPAYRRGRSGGYDPVPRDGLAPRRTLTPTWAPLLRDARDRRKALRRRFQWHGVFVSPTRWDPDAGVCGVAEQRIELGGGTGEAKAQ
jgi:hypothetical protein